MSETLREYCDSTGATVQVDRSAAVIHGVKVLGVRSRNGRVYLPEALLRAAGLYEGVKVNVNHPKGGPAAPRDYQDRLGVIRHVRFRPDQGLFGDLFYNPKHPIAEQLVWDAEHQARNVGLSHNVEAVTRHDRGQLVVEAINAVESVDLVADPATTKGLFEQQDSATSESDGSEVVAEERTTSSDASAAQAELKRLREEVDRLRAERRTAERRQQIREQLKACGLPDPDTAAGHERPLVSDTFIEQLLKTDDADRVRRMIEERAALVRAVSHQGGPQSRDQLSGERLGRCSDARQFVRAIT